MQMTTDNNDNSPSPVSVSPSDSIPIPRRTPLYALHGELGARMTDFAGWSMPLHYSDGIKNEHLQCRERAVLFDVSHMGQIELRGDDAATRLESLVPSDIQTLPEGKARYTVFTDHNGAILDDLIVTRAGDHLLLVVNASMRDQDVRHLQENLSGVDIIEKTEYALLALQGPASVEVLRDICSDATGLLFMESVETSIEGMPCRLSRAGYTGEDGFEISMANSHADAIARLLLSHHDCTPAGLGARDSLRLEAGLCLYGNDIDSTTTPVEADLLWAIPERRRQQGGFPGAARIQRQIAEGTDRKRVGVRPAGRIPARQGVEILSPSGLMIGTITSGCFGPGINAPVSMAYVQTEFSQPGTEVQLMIRGKAHPAIVASMPFVKLNYKR